jgi:hypothetical protein
LAEFDDNFRVAPGSSSIATNRFKVSLPLIIVDQGRYMTGFDRVGDGFFDERPRTERRPPLSEGTINLVPLGMRVRLVGERLN